MIIQEQLENNLIKTYSDQGFYIHGGYPEADYAEAIDPISEERAYIETNIPIEQQEETLEEITVYDQYSIVGKILMGVIK